MAQKYKRWAQDEILTLLWKISIRLDLIDIADNTKKRIRYHDHELKTPKELANETDALIVDFLKQFGLDKKDLGYSHPNPATVEHPR